MKKGGALPRRLCVPLRERSLLDGELFFGLFLVFELELFFLVRLAGEDDRFLVLFLRLLDLGLVAGRLLLLLRLLLVLARAHLRRLLAGADVAVLARVL